MRISEFIKMLKEADPTGEGFIMMSDGGVPKWFEGKPGYYDGAYSYIDVDGRMVKSTKENKVDVICKEKEWVIWDDLDWLMRQEMAVFVEREEPYHFDHDHWFNRAKSLFIFDGTVPESHKEKFYESIKSDFNDWVNYKQEEDKKWMDQTLKEYEDGKLSGIIPNECRWKAGWLALWHNTGSLLQRSLQAHRPRRKAVGMDTQKTIRTQDSSM